MSEALKSEREYFENNPVYKDVKNKSGIPYLTLQLSKLLNQHILKCLPDLKKKIDQQLQERRVELASYGHSVSDNPDAGRAYLLGIISTYSKYFHDSVEGNAKTSDNNDYKVGARIQIIFQEYFVSDINNLDPFDELTDEDIRTAILNAKALNPSLFIPEAAFELLIRQQINRLLVPSLSCALQIHNELRNMAIYTQITELDRFEKLKDRIGEVVTELLKDCLEPTEKMIRNLIEVELGYINVNHPDVLTGISAVLSMLRGYDDGSGVKEQVTREEEKSKSPRRQAVKAVPNPAIEKTTYRAIDGEGGLSSLPDMIRAEGEPSAREALEVKIIKELMLSYFKVVVIRTADIVPKIIVSFLVESSLSRVHDKLVEKIFAENGWQELMEENPIIAEKKASCKKIIGLLTETQKALNEIRNAKFD